MNDLVNKKELLGNLYEAWKEDNPYLFFLNGELQRTQHSKQIEKFMKWVENHQTVKEVDYGYLVDWYITSVGDEATPVWTEEHIEELLKDFIVIPRGNDNEEED